MSSLKSTNNKSIENKSDDFDNDKQSNDKNNRTKSTTKRPRAPIACFRCHHKKVRCDGARPNCTRCLSTGVLCAYPSSRRSRTTQPTNVDPFIDNLSQLEARIRQIEIDLASQRSMVHSMLSSPTTNDSDNMASTANELNSKMIKTEIEVQDSRSILAQLRLRGEQRILRGKRAAAAAAAAAAASSNNTSKTNKSLTKEEKTNTKQKQSNIKLNANKTNSKLKQNSTTAVIADSEEEHSSFYYQNMMLDNNNSNNNNNNSNSVMNNYHHSSPSGHGMDWTLFDQENEHKNQVKNDYAQTLEHQNEMIFSNSHNNNNQYLANMPPSSMFYSATGPTNMVPTNTNDMFYRDPKEPHMTSMVLDTSPTSTRSSSLASNLGFPVIIQPSNSTNSTGSNMTALSSATSCSSLNTCNNIFNFSMDDVMLQSNTNETNQDVNMLCNNSSSVWYYN